METWGNRIRYIGPGRHPQCCCVRGGGHPSCSRSAPGNSRKGVPAAQCRMLCPFAMSGVDHGARITNVMAMSCAFCVLTLCIRTIGGEHELDLQASMPPPVVLRFQRRSLVVWAVTGRSLTPRRCRGWRQHGAVAGEVWGTPTTEKREGLGVICGRSLFSSSAFFVLQVARGAQSRVGRSINSMCALDGICTPTQRISTVQSGRLRVCAWAGSMIR